jgi:hypothetical protein
MLKEKHERLSDREALRMVAFTSLIHLWSGPDAVVQTA